MHRADFHAAFGNAVARHRAVNAARKQQHRLAARAHGHAAHGLQHAHIQIRHIADFHVHHMLGRMDIHMQIGAALQDIAAHLHIDFRRGHGIALIRAARLHLEGAAQALHHPHRLIADRIKIVLFHFDRRTQRMHAEHLADGLHAAVHIVHIADKNTGVMQPYAAAEGAHRLLDARHQRAHKIRAIETLQIYFAVANQNQLTHGRAYLLS